MKENLRLIELKLSSLNSGQGYIIKIQSNIIVKKYVEINTINLTVVTFGMW